MTKYKHYDPKQNGGHKYDALNLPLYYSVIIADIGTQVDANIYSFKGPLLMHNF